MLGISYCCICDLYYQDTFSLKNVATLYTYFDIESSNIINVYKAYQNTLKRNPDDIGINIYTKFLEKGKSYDDLEALLKESDEYKEINTT